MDRMTTRDREPSPLVAAAAGLEAELAQLEAIVAAARRAPLDSQKHLQKAASTLGGMDRLETTLREALSRLVGAIGEAGGRQQAALEGLAECAHRLEARLAELRELEARREAFGDEATRVNQSIKALLAQGDPAAALPEAIRELGVVAQAGKALFAEAKARGFTDVAREADSVQQQLHGLRRKLLQLAPEHDLQVDLQVAQDDDTLSRARVEEAQRAQDDGSGAPA